MFGRKTKSKADPCDCQSAIARLNDMEQYWEIDAKHPSLRFRKRYMRELCKPGTCTHSDTFRAKNALARNRRSTNMFRQRKAKVGKELVKKFTLGLAAQIQYIEKMERQMFLMGWADEQHYCLNAPYLKEMTPQLYADMKAGKFQLKTDSDFEQMITTLNQYEAELEKALDTSICLKDLKEGRIEPNWLGSTTRQRGA